MFENGLDVGHIIRHPVFLATFIVAIPAWIIAFAGQCAAEAQYTSQYLDLASSPTSQPDAHRPLAGTSRPVVGTLWFSIWIQL